jgi:hypothetical protein
VPLEGAPYRKPIYDVAPKHRQDVDASGYVNHRHNVGQPLGYFVDGLCSAEAITTSTGTCASLPHRASLCLT